MESLRATFRVAMQGFLRLKAGAVLMGRKRMEGGGLESQVSGRGSAIRSRKWQKRPVVGWRVRKSKRGC